MKCFRENQGIPDQVLKNDYKHGAVYQATARPTVPSNDSKKRSLERVSKFYVLIHGLGSTYHEKITVYPTYLSIVIKMLIF